MKIVFNLPITVNYFQIYDELSKNFDVILPDNYKDTSNMDINVNLDALERAVKSADGIDFILGFEGELPELIKWKKRNIDIPLVIYTSNLVNRPNFARLSLYSIVWYVEKYATSLMKRYNPINILYAGMAANQFIFHPLNIERIYDIGFFGQFYGERRYWLSTIQGYAKNNNIKTHFIYGHSSKIRLSWEDLNKIYNQNKINLSFAPMESSGRIVNMRTFEICLTGTLQLMEYTPCLEEYFEIGEEIVCWSSKKELFDKLTYFIKNDDEREKIAKKGYERAIKEHTWSNRAETINLFLKERKQKLENIDKSVIPLNKFHATGKSGTIDHLELTNTEKILSEVVKPMLMNLGYNIKRNLKKNKGFTLDLRTKTVYYKPNLRGYYFIKIYSKIVMIIQIIPQNKEINMNHWQDLEKIRMLIDNVDYEMPQFGIITNGIDWLAKDFKNKKWLYSVPTYQDLKSNLKLKDIIMFRFNYHLIKAKIFSIIFKIPYIKYLFKVYYKLPNLNSILKYSRNYRKLKYLVKRGILNRYIYETEIKLVNLIEKDIEIYDDLILKKKKK